MSRLEVEGLVNRYHADAVLNDVGFTIPQGRTLAVLGPSGCGKTTLLLCLAGLLEHESGRILIDGRDVTHTPAEERGIVLLHQENTLFPHLNVGQNIAFGLRLRGRTPSQIDAKVAQMLKLVRLEGLAARRIDQLSGGERQRVALARALAIDPKVLLLDEPFSSLDRNLRIALREDLRRWLHELGVTALFVTHDREEAAWMGDDVLLLEAGRILDHGPFSRVHAAPATAAAARLLGRRNIYPYERGPTGLLETPLGLLAAPEGAPERGELLVREEDVLVTPTGGLELAVHEARSLGARTLVRLGDPPAELVLDLPTSQAPQTPTLRIQVPTTSIHVFARPPPERI